MTVLKGLMDKVFGHAADPETIAGADAVFEHSTENGQVLFYAAYQSDYGSAGRIVMVDADDYETFKAGLGVNAQTNSLSSLSSISSNQVAGVVSQELALLNAIRDPEQQGEFLRDGSQYEALKEISQFFNSEMNMGITYDSLVLKVGEDPSFQVYLDQAGININDANGFRESWASLAERADMAVAQAEHAHYADDYRSNFFTTLEAQDIDLGNDVITNLERTLAGTALEDVAQPDNNQFSRFESAFAAAPGG